VTYRAKLQILNIKNQTLKTNERNDDISSIRLALEYSLTGKDYVIIPLSIETVISHNSK
jgi:hypothetical protein